MMYRMLGQVENHSVLGGQPAISTCVRKGGAPCVGFPELLIYQVKEQTTSRAKNAQKAT